MVSTNHSSTTEAGTGPGGLGCWLSRGLKWFSHGSNFSSGGYDLLAVWEKGSADKIPFHYLSVLLEVSYTKAKAAWMSWKWMYLIFTKKWAANQEAKWSVVPLRTSDCKTIFSFLFLRGLEETPVTGAKAVVRTHWNRIKNHTFPSSPSTWQWSCIVATVLLFTRQKTTNWTSRLGGAGSLRRKIPWQEEDWGRKMVIVWEGEVAHGTHVWKREEKSAVKAKGQIIWWKKAKQN